MSSKQRAALMRQVFAVTHLARIGCYITVDALAHEMAVNTDGNEATMQAAGFSEATVALRKHTFEVINEGRVTCELALVLIDDLALAMLAEINP